MMLAVDLCRASVHPEEPLREMPDLGLDQADPYLHQIPRTRHRDLQREYLDNYLDLDGGLERLANELRQEDRVQSEVQRILHQDRDGFRWASSYAEPLAFAGGGSQLVHQVEVCAALVAKAAERTPAGVPRFYCALRPALGLGARSFATEGGVVVLLDTGFLAALRVFIQTVASSLKTIGHVPEAWVDGDIPVTGQFGSVQDVLDRCEVGQDVRDDPIQISIQTGPQELLRRHAMLSALCQLIAHELGHWARSRPGPEGSWIPDNAEFQRSARVKSADQLAQPIDEVDELATGNAEHHADSIALAIQRQPPLWFNQSMLGQMIGAASPMAVHAGLWWRRAAHTDRGLGWTHPYPDLRMGTVRLLLASHRAGELSADEQRIRQQPGSNENMARRFELWARGMLDIERNRAAAIERGLTDRGLSVMSRVAIDVNHRLREEAP